MQFEEPQVAKKVGVIVGYAFSYALFTTILFFLLSVIGRIPGSLAYVHIMVITASIAILGFVVKRLLK